MYEMEGHSIALALEHTAGKKQGKGTLFRNIQNTGR
jgi:hypothetical protein